MLDHERRPGRSAQSGHDRCPRHDTGRTAAFGQAPRAHERRVLGRFLPVRLGPQLLSLRMSEIGWRALVRFRVCGSS
jgi:hypothetical protein